MILNCFHLELFSYQQSHQVSLLLKTYLFWFCVCVNVSLAARRDCWIPWNWGCRWWQATMWGLGLSLGPHKALSPSIQHLKQLFPTIPWHRWPDSSFKIIQQNFTNKVLSIQDLFFGEVFFYPSGIYVVINTKRVLELYFWDRVWLCNAGCPIRPG